MADGVYLWLCPYLWPGSQAVQAGLGAEELAESPAACPGPMDSRRPVDAGSVPLLLHAVASQLQALGIPGPETVLYRLFASAGRCRCSTCGCLELLALGSRDERSVTPRFMGRARETSRLGCFCIWWVIFLYLIPPSCLPPLFLGSLGEAAGRVFT